MENEKSKLILGFLHPKWMLILISVPMLILAILFISYFFIVKSELFAASFILWITHMAFTGLVSLASATYAAVLIKNKKEIHGSIPFITLALNTAYMYFSVYTFIIVLSNAIPEWIVNRYTFILIYSSCLMPSFFYSIFSINAFLHKIIKKENIFINLIIMISIPLSIFGFFFLTRIIGLTSYNFYILYQIMQHVYFAVISIMTIGFFLFAVKIIMLLSGTTGNIIKKIKYILLPVFTLILPLAGIALNEGYFPFSFLRIGNDIFHELFGNFSNPLFLIFTAVSGILLILPQLNNKIYRICLFILRSITLSFTSYFFIVFLPFIPISLGLTVVLGLGLLIASPLILFFIHINIIKNDIIYLKDFFSKKILFAALFLFSIIIPLIITGFIFAEKINLEKALNYVFARDYIEKKSPEINIKMLDMTLKNIEKNKTLSRNITSGTNRNRTPIISALYNKILFNNQILSDIKINLIKRIYLDEDNIYYQSSDTPDNNVKISKLNHKTIYNTQKKIYETQIDLELTNLSRMSNVEYLAYFRLPEGARISGYYLFVGDNKKNGIMTEKRAALWIYNQIKTVRKDPGLLYYLENGIITFRVFPFAQNEIRKTGFTIAHLEPLEFNFDSYRIITDKKLTAGTNSAFTSKNEKVIYIPAEVKKKLSVYKRKPYYHFVLDCSVSGEFSTSGYVPVINKILNENSISPSNAKVTLCGYALETFDLDNTLGEKLKKHKNRGGFFLDRAIKSIIINNYKSGSPSFPLIVVLSNQKKQPIIQNDIDMIKQFYIAGDYGSSYRIDETGKEIYSAYWEIQLVFMKDYTNDYFKIILLPEETVLIFTHKNREYFLKNDGKPSIIMTYDAELKDFDNIDDGNYKDAMLNIAAMEKYFLINPGSKEIITGKLFASSVKNNILSKNTSLIVVENEMQEKMLLKKQNELLNTKQHFDSIEKIENSSMSEPHVIIILSILLICFIFIKMRKRKANY